MFSCSFRFTTLTTHLLIAWRAAFRNSLIRIWKEHVKKKFPRFVYAVTDLPCVRVWVSGQSAIHTVRGSRHRWRPPTLLRKKRRRGGGLGGNTGKQKDKTTLEIIVSRQQEREWRYDYLANTFKRQTRWRSNKEEEGERNITESWWDSEVKAAIAGR